MKLKKVILFSIFVISIALLVIVVGPETLFTPGAVKKVRGGKIEDLEKKANILENNFISELEKSEKLGNVLEKLGMKYIKRGDWTQGIKTLQKAIGHGSGGAKVHHFIAVAYSNRGKEIVNDKDVNLAIQHYKLSISKNKNMLDSYYGLAMIYYYQKKGDLALNLLKKIIDKDSKYYLARFAYAKILYEDDKKISSMSTYQDLLSDLETRKSSPVIDKLKQKCIENISRLASEQKVYLNE